MDFRDLSALGGRQRVFRARAKVNEPGFISHITQRAAGKEPLFVEDGDYLTMLGLLKDVAERFEVTVLAMCLMPNHVHLLLKPSERNLSEAMQAVFSRYAKQFNRKYERRGHLFGGPYRQAVCLDNTYLLTASVYIHLNPVRAGLIHQAASYRWSSCGLYCRRAEDGAESFIDPGPVLSVIDSDLGQARQEYSRLVQSGRELQPENALEQEGVIEKFCNRLASVFPNLFARIGKKESLQDESGQELMELTTLEHKLEEFRQQSAKGPETRQARRYLIEQLLARGYKKTQIAERLGVSRQTVYDTLHSS